jgi:hypothetical protein
VELKSLVGQIDDFHGWTYSEQIKLFAWFLHTYRDKASFEAKDIAACFDSLSLARPPSVHPFLSALAKKDPPEILKKKQEFHLENRVRNDYDKRFGQRAATIQVDALLTQLPGKIAIPAEKGYLEETLSCYRVKAFRAAVVMCWNLAFDHLCEFVLKDPARIGSFNTQLPKSFPKANVQSISYRDHFNELKEDQVLQVCKSAQIISGNLHKILKEKLDRRNIAAHPSATVTSQHTAEEFILDLVQNVVLKLS